MQLRSKNGVLKSIEESLRTAVNEKRINEFGLFDGLAGVGLFFLYLSKFKSSTDDLRYGLAILDDVVEKVSESSNDLSYCSGLSGIGWIIQHSKEKGFDVDADYLLSELDKQVADDMLKDIYNRNLDFLYGAMGKFYYLLNRSHITKNRRYLREAANSIFNIAEKREKDFFWFFYNILESRIEKQVNLGISHGMAPIPMLLSQYSRRFSDVSKIRKTIDQSVNHIVNQLDFKGFWVAPFFSDGSREAGRLAWCYGDVGLGICLIRTGLNTNDRKCVELGLRIVNSTADRRDPIQNKVLDACVCHGTAGLVAIYNAIFQQFGGKKYEIAANYWLKKTIEYSELEGGQFGYLLWRPDKGWTAMGNGLLEGLAGVGLAIISKSDKRFADWEKCLLIR